MTLSHDEVSGRLVDFLYESLPADEQAAVADHVAGCPHCKAEIAAWRSVRARTRSALRGPLDEAPPGHLRAAILAAAAKANVAARPTLRQTNPANTPPAATPVASAGDARLGPRETRKAKTGGEASSWWGRWLGGWRRPWVIPAFTMAAVLGLFVASRTTLFRSYTEEAIQLAPTAKPTTPAREDHGKNVANALADKHAPTADEDQSGHGQSASTGGGPTRAPMQRERPNDRREAKDEAMAAPKRAPAATEKWAKKREETRAPSSDRKPTTSEPRKSEGAERDARIRQAGAPGAGPDRTARASASVEESAVATARGRDAEDVLGGLTTRAAPAPAALGAGSGSVGRGRFATPPPPAESERAENDGPLEGAANAAPHKPSAPSRAAAPRPAPDAKAPPVPAQAPVAASAPAPTRPAPAPAAEPTPQASAALAKAVSADARASSVEPQADAGGRTREDRIKRAEAAFTARNWSIAARAFRDLVRLFPDDARVPSWKAKAQEAERAAVSR